MNTARWHLLPENCFPNWKQRLIRVIKSCVSHLVTINFWAFCSCRCNREALPKERIKSRLERDSGYWSGSVRHAIEAALQGCSIPFPLNLSYDLTALAFRPSSNPIIASPAHTHTHTHTLIQTAVFTLCGSVGTSCWPQHRHTNTTQGHRTLNLINSWSRGLFFFFSQKSVYFWMDTLRIRTRTDRFAQRIKTENYFWMAESPLSVPHGQYLCGRVVFPSLSPHRDFFLLFFSRRNLKS